MADKLTPERRSWNMSRISGKDTKPEITVRKYLTEKGVRYRKNVSGLPGKPDIAIKKYKLAMEIRGCFWHGHSNCERFRLPKSKTEFWADKISKNKNRDMANEIKLADLDFSLYVIWECEVLARNFEKADDFIKEYFKRRNTA